MNTDPTREVTCSHCGAHQFDGCFLPFSEECRRKELTPEPVTVTEVKDENR
jgi:hypothetical protein